MRMAALKTPIRVKAILGKGACLRNDSAARKPTSSSIRKSPSRPAAIHRDASSSYAALKTQTSLLAFTTSSYRRANGSGGKERSGSGRQDCGAVRSWPGAAAFGGDYGREKLDVGDQFKLGDLDMIVVGIMDSAGKTFRLETWQNDRVGKPFGKLPTQRS